MNKNMRWLNGNDAGDAVLARVARSDLARHERAFGAETQRKHPAARLEFVHATVQDDLIGPGHVFPRSRSRSRPRDCRDLPRPSSKLLMKSGMEIHLPQRGRYIVVEDMRATKRASPTPAPTPTPTPELVLVSKENGSVALHSVYHNPSRAAGLRMAIQPWMHQPRVDYYRGNWNTQPFAGTRCGAGLSASLQAKAWSMMDLSRDVRVAARICDSRYNSSLSSGSGCSPARFNFRLVRCCWSLIASRRNERN